MTLYHDTIMDYYRNPRHFGCSKFKASASSSTHNPSCGDAIKMKIYIHKGKITRICFEGEGCALSIAAASLLCEYTKGKLLREVQSFDEETVLHLLQIDVTPARTRCATIGLKALRQAIATL